MKTVVGLIDHLEEAEAAVRELTASGFRREDISLVASDRRDERGAEFESDGEAAEGAAYGATGGAVLGGIGGLLVGLGALAIPGFGPLIAAGPLVAALTGAAVGAGVGGMVGGLMQMGVPEEEAHLYAEGVRRGGSLVIVNASRDGDWTAVDILQRHGAADIEQQHAQAATATAATTREREPAIPSSATLDRPPAQSQIPESLDDDLDWDPDCRKHFEDNISGSGRSYDEVRPAYEFGYHASADPRYSTAPWDDTEPTIRQDWSTRGQGAWDEVKDAVRCGWDCGRRRAVRSGPKVEEFS